MEYVTLQGMAQALVASIRLDDPLPVICLAQEHVDQIPDPVDLEMHSIAFKPKKPYSQNQIHELIVLTEAYLRSPKGIKSKQYRCTAISAAIIQHMVINTILPGSMFCPKTAYATQPLAGSLPLDKLRFQLMATAGLHLLAHLDDHFASTLDNTSLELTICLTSFTNPKDPWNRVESAEVATRLLISHLKHQSLATRKDANIVSKLLSNTVRLSFANNRSHAITDQGRKVAYQLVNPSGVSHSKATDKPWKFEKPYVVTIFKWCLQQLDEFSLESNWASVIPPILAMIDDESTVCKTRGCESLVTLLKIVPAHLLERTGLGEVFLDGLLPLLSYLPPLTPETESLVLLRHTYKVLLCLCKAWYPGAPLCSRRLRILDRILRTGVLAGYSQASENVNVAIFLVERMAEIVEVMGIHSVKHLNSIVQILVAILCDPFGNASPKLLASTLDAMQTVMLNDWPRIPFYSGEVLKGLAVCWCGILIESDQQEWGFLKELLKRTLEIFKAAVAEEKNMIEDIDVVLRSDERLRELRGIWLA